MFRHPRWSTSIVIHFQINSLGLTCTTESWEFEKFTYQTESPAYCEWSITFSCGPQNSFPCLTSCLYASPLTRPTKCAGRGVDLLREMEVIMRVASCGLLAIAVLTTTPLFAQSTLQQP